jgi:hypothetical protein
MTKRIMAVMAIALLAGCDSAPTISAGAAGPLHDGGVVFGSGHRSGSGSDTTGTSTTSATGENENATTQEERGGVVFGSGH